MQLAASLPSDSPSLKALTSKFVGSLWQGLNHPPLTYLGDEWKYRTADGSNNVSPPAVRDRNPNLTLSVEQDGTMARSSRLKLCSYSGTDDTATAHAAGCRPDI